MKTGMILLFLLIYSCISVAQKLTTADGLNRKLNLISLNEQGYPFQSRGYTLKILLDPRINKAPVASLFLLKEKTRLAEKQNYSLQGGLLHALSAFFIQGKGSDALNILLKVRACSIHETLLKKGLTGKILFSIDFYRMLDRDTLFLDSYSASSTYLRSEGLENGIVPAFISILAQARLYLDQWIFNRINSDLRLAHAVSLRYSDYAEKIETDTIYYNKNRPLQWADFQAEPEHGNKFGAELFPIFSYTEHITSLNGVIHIEIALKAALAKSNSWAKISSRDGYSLNHEQRHFDLIKIASEYFKKELSKHTYSLINYEGEISALYLDAYRGMSSSEQCYDTETHHGEDQLAQERWNVKIARELLALSIP